MSTANKLTYLNGTKQAIKQAINEDFEVIDNNTTFREYADEISSNNAKYKDLIPKETKNATNTLDISNSAGLDKALVTLYGNTYQEGEPNPDYPQDIQVVTGDNTIIVSNSDNTQSQSYHVSLGNIELCKIGNYKDRIYPLNGKWYLHKEIEEFDLSSITFWSKNANGDFYLNSFATDYGFKTEECLSNIFSYSPTAWVKNCFGITSAGVLWCSTKDETLTTYQQFITYLTNKSAIMYGVLATPTTTEITENNYPTLYNQLNNIKLFEGVNHITMTNERGLDVEFDITYYKDWKLD